MDLEYDVVGGYIPFFVQHLKDTRAPLGLPIGSQANEHQGAVEEAEARALSNWTPAELDAFFRALSVHSRWRPDLIATCVPTKTEWEVWMYLEALEQGAAQLAKQQDDQDVDMEDVEGQNVVMQDDSDSRSPSGFDADQDEDACEPALEVSQAWIDAEERMATWIIDQEQLPSVESDAATNTGEVDDRPRKRKRGRPRGAKKGRAQSRSREQTVSSKGSPPPHHRYPSPEPTATSAREPSRESSAFDKRQREALMGRLEVPHLLVLDSILRMGEEAMKEKSKSREGSITANTPMDHGDEGTLHVGDTDVSSLSDRITGPPGTSNNVHESSSSNAVIDPVLLALTGDVDPTGCHSGQATNGSTATSCTPAHVPAEGVSSLPNASSQPPWLEVFSQPGTSNVFTSPQDNATPADPDPTANADSDLSLFSPRTRRRIQKRLYMRRKRALLRENGTVPGGAVGTGIMKLKPGKKLKSERSETLVVSIFVPGSEAPSDGEEEVPENVPKKNKVRGLTLPYKLKGQFAGLGVDAAYLRGQGMDLLNLGALGRLMGLYSSLEHGEEEVGGSAIVEFIDAQLVQHLQAAMVSFVTDIIHRAIVWREREIRLKQRSRAWRQGDQITVGVVEHAVEAIGARYHSHKAYFKSVEAFLGPSAEASSVPGNATEREPNPTDACVDPDAGTTDLSAELPGLSPHRDVYTPLVYPPRMTPLSCLTRTYEQEATRTRRGTTADTEEDELMPDETDEEALEAELREEEEADERDMEFAARHERALWDGVKKQ